MFNELNYMVEYEWHQLKQDGCLYYPTFVSLPWFLLSFLRWPLIWCCSPVLVPAIRLWAVRFTTPLTSATSTRTRITTTRSRITTTSTRFTSPWSVRFLLFHFGFPSSAGCIRTWRPAILTLKTTSKAQM